MATGRSVHALQDFMTTLFALRNFDGFMKCVMYSKRVLLTSLSEPQR
jgi:hypothetical protein